MAEDSIVEFIEEYQTGFFLVLGSIVGAAVVVVGFVRVVDAVFGWSSPGAPIVLGVFVAGTAGTFLLLSYLLYGR
jgi:hypothetical protein